MALMTFREPNQVRWFGIRPGHRGTQVLLDVNVTNNTQVLIDGTQITITYLTDWFLGMVRNKDVGNSMEITENDDTHICYLAVITSFTGSPSFAIAQALTYPIEIPAGYKLKVNSVGVNATTFGYIHGWEE